MHCFRLSAEVPLDFIVSYAVASLKKRPRRSGSFLLLMAFRKASWPSLFRLTRLATPCPPPRILFDALPIIGPPLLGHPSRCGRWSARAKASHNSLVLIVLDHPNSPERFEDAVFHLDFIMSPPRLCTVPRTVPQSSARRSTTISRTAKKPSRTCDRPAERRRQRPPPTTGRSVLRREHASTLSAKSAGVPQTLGPAEQRKQTPESVGVTQAGVLPCRPDANQDRRP